MSCPAFFAADGDAANTSATSGNVWQAIFTPDQTGTYQFRVSFRQGAQVAISLDPDAGTPIAPDGLTGSFTIGETDKSPPDFRARGMLRYVGTRYFRFDDGTYFLKGGAGSPENFLAHAEFDNTIDHGGAANDLSDGLHHYGQHISDWKNGDPTWKNGLGKGIIGAVNCLASEGVNSLYFLTMNVNGDGREVYPWTSYGERFRFDVSKLAQWDIVFRHMQQKGILLHVITQEQENDQLLDGGDLGVMRKLYYRELVARFAYHPALIWNLGEENTNTTAQQKAFAEYIRALDPYDHPIVVHTFPQDHEKVYAPLLGYPNVEGPSLQLSKMEGGYAATLTWVERSASAGRPWVVMLDEPGNAAVGCSPDGSNNNHYECRTEALWANLMAGGGGVEWYFGYQRPHNDLDLEDFRSRDRLWDYTRFARQFFEEHLPFWEMEPIAAADAGAPADAYVLVQPDGQGWKRAALYFPTGQGTVRPPEGTYEVYWFDPRNGGALQQTSPYQITGGQSVTLAPPSANGQDWAVLLVRSDTGGGVGALEAEPEMLDFGTVEVGETVRQTLTLRNVGVGPLTLAALALKGAGSNVFAIAEQPALPMDLPGGQEVGLTLQFTPDTATTYEGMLELMDATGAVLHAVPLRGRGQESGVEQLAVTALVLVDATTDSDLFVLRPDTVLQEENLPGAINIRAEVQGSVGSVVFWVNEVPVRTENEAPYTLAGDDRGDYQPGNMRPVYT
ncbi:choice-of-anchor D domain-containing protein [Rhodothermus marinus]|uniref:choice-of-anchor D domain-containing protein n=1 Tax=Rhodothermus marinus TaxID=29549 RepID=UPI0006D16497|nr:choice-of-anchor D domain-containing protein [Rhodothermus marinus]